MPLTSKKNPKVFEASSTVVVADAASIVNGFINGGGLLAVPIVAATGIVAVIGLLLQWSSQPAVRDDEDDWDIFQAAYFDWEAWIVCSFGEDSL